MKCDITYTCGHAGTVSLFGKMCDRERMISYYESSVLCPTCSKQKRDEANKAMGVVLSFVCDWQRDAIIVVAVGDTYSHKEELKALGFSFGEVVCNFLPSNRNGENQKCWYYNLKCGSKEEILGLRTQYDAMVQRVREGVSTHVSEHPTSDTDKYSILEVVQKKLDEFECLASEPVETPKEEKPAYHEASLEQFELVELKGSPRQIQWAEKLRKKSLVLLLNEGKDITPFLKMERCRFWIDCQGYDYDQMCDALGSMKPERKWFRMAVSNASIVVAKPEFIVVKIPGEKREFEFPRKMTRRGRNAGEAVLLFSDAYTFRVRSAINRRINGPVKVPKVFEEVEYSAMLELFGGDISVELAARESWREPEEEFFHTPEPKTPMEIQADENLKR